MKSSEYLDRFVRPPIRYTNKVYQSFEGRP